MKKLMTILASAATALFAVGSVSAEVLNKADFESYTAGVFDSELADDATDDADKGMYWYCATTGADSGLVVTNYESSGTGVPIADRPDVFREGQGEPNSKFLSLDTTTPLFRKTTDKEVGAVSIPEGGSIYLDTLVKFTAAEAPFADDLEPGDKIAISYVAGADEFDGVTNFVIRAGYIVGEDIVQTNYFAAVPQGFDLAAWHRLTVRTLSDIDGNDNVGFAVYVDETQLAYNAIELVEGSPANAGFNAGENPDRTIFPSAIAGLATGGKTIASAAFSGSGCIDDVVFTTTTPAFIANSEAVIVNINVGSGVSSVVVKVGETTYEGVNGVYSLPAQTASMNLTVLWDTEHGYTTGTIISDDDELAAGDIEITTGMTITIKGTRNNVTYIDANDAEQSCTTLSEAFANAKPDSTITLAYDIVIAQVEDADFEGYAINKALVLDLHGKSIDGGTDTEDAALFEIPAGGSLTVIDSVGGGEITYATEYGIFYAVGDCFIGAVDDDEGVTVNGKLVGDDSGVWVIRGKFDAENNTAESAFAWTLGDGDAIASEATLVNSYWVVAPTGEEPADTYELTITADSDKVEYTAKIGDQDVASGDDVEDGSTITVVATPKEGYEYAETPTGWEEGETEGTITATFTVDGAALEISIPDPTAVTPVPETWTVSITLGDHVNSVSYSFVDDLATTNTLTATGSFTIAQGNAFVFVDVDVDENYVLDIDSTTNSIVGATINAFFAITPTADASGTIYAKSTQQGGYPTYIGDDTAKQEKYDTWAATYGADADSQYEEAFLLNCAPADVATEKAAFKLNITVDGTTVTVTTPAGKSYNGTVQLKGSNDLSTWTNVDSASTSYNFYKAELK